MEGRNSLKSVFAAFMAAGLIFSGTVSAAEQSFDLGNLVISETRLTEPLREAGSSGSVVTREELEKRGIKTVRDALRHTAGFDAASGGEFGGPSSVFLRGANAGQTLVMIDGVKVYDPISTNASFDFSHLGIGDVEKIEIIRGPQSSLYGSDAIGGVVNIITRKGEGTPEVSLEVEGGSFHTFREKISSRGSLGRLDYSFGVSRVDSRGISKASEEYGNTEKDGYRGNRVSFHLNSNSFPEMTLGVTGYYNRSKFDIDDFGGIGGDNPDRRNSLEMVLLAPYLEQAINDFWEHKLICSFMRHTRHDDDHGANHLRSHFKGENTAFDWQNNFFISPSVTLVGGMEYNRENGESYYFSDGIFGPFEDILEKKKADNLAFYAANKLNIADRFFNTLALRVDNHSRFDEKLTYRGTAAYYPFPSFKLRGSYGTGFKAPSLYQLFSSYGDTSLKPEESRGFDLGFDKTLLKDEIALGITYFSNDFRELIDYDLDTSRYKNISKSQSSGWETEVNWKITDSFKGVFTHTYLNADDVTNSEPLLRRAKNKLNLNLNYEILDKANFNLNVSHFEGRFDKTGFPATLVPLKDYTLVDLSASFRVNESLDIYVRGENVLDRRYEEVKGYGTKGRAAYGGFTLTF